jgi:hypothetical protein
VLFLFGTVIMSRKEFERYNQCCRDQVAKYQSEKHAAELEAREWKNVAQNLVLVTKFPYPLGFKEK